ncbi:SHOCT domain-containing protein [Dyadobacter sp. CY261]|uniref:SHOCT domain-containing protein n=1 Tax=Dyadobacter sp. CY261 TaxID=2907203 RepID=UPI001F382F4B|nr:SHOCT domain-containing protein [Dyadobacter sp. CY261]MCF0071886.1 SHOCT domain-containing protein [Dyadobacter sp. CY261]
MKKLTPEGWQKVNEIASRYDLHTETIESLLNAIIRGGGTMAQFNLAELGGQGQWMKGGMTMVGDMFNNSLRANVDKLCHELADLIMTDILFEEKEGDSEEKITSPFRPVNTSWPSIFGNPTSSGSQNGFRYAYFASVRRLVIEENGKRTIYDTKHHQISGVSQQHGAVGSYRFTSQEGAVDLGSLEIVSDPDKPSQPTPEIAYDVTATADLRSGDQSPQDIIISTIGKLNVLFEKGQITEEEFKAKKEELLSRL